MPWWLLALILWFTPACLLALCFVLLELRSRWHDAQAIRRADVKFAARNGIDLHTTRAGFLGGRR